MESQRPQTREVRSRPIHEPSVTGMAIGAAPGFVSGFIIMRHVDGRQNEIRQEIKFLKGENNGIRISAADNTPIGHERLTTNQEQIRQLEADIPTPPPGHDIGILAVMTALGLTIGAYAGHILSHERIQRLLTKRSAEVTD